MEKERRSETISRAMYEAGYKEPILFHTLTPAIVIIGVLVLLTSLLSVEADNLRREVDGGWAKVDGKWYNLQTDGKNLYLDGHKITNPLK